MFDSSDYQPLKVFSQGEPLELRVWRARGRARRQGLSGSQELPKDCGLLIPGAPVIHMRGMNYSLDLIFLNPRGRIRKILSADPGWRLYGSWSSWSCLEVSQGVASELEFEVGQTVNFQAAQG